MRETNVRKVFSALVGIVVISVMLTGCVGAVATSTTKPVSPAATSAAVPASTAAVPSTNAGVSISATPAVPVPTPAGPSTSVSSPLPASASVVAPPSPSAAPGKQPAQGAQPKGAKKNAGTSTATDATPTAFGPAAAAATVAASVIATSVTVASTSMTSQPFPGNVLLWQPTADSITLSLLAPAAAELFIQYGKNPNQYDLQTGVSSLQKDQPLDIKITGLSKDTQYYYRICYKNATDTSFNAGTEGAFITQRPPGESFVFTVDADPHFDSGTDPAKVKLAFQNILNEHPDFDIDLGDTFMSEKLAPKSYDETAAIYQDRRNFYGVFGGSVPLYMVLGNHDALTPWDNQARDVYYPNPTADSFYSGGRNYYSWEWGGSLFVVLDPFSFTTAKGAAGWDWTLGKVQYDWLKATMEKSQAKYKFVFTHHLIGGNDLGAGGNGRGGVETARFFEWGGQNTDGTPGFDTNRPGWGKPIQQLLVDNHVTIVFHGHDHFFGKQEFNGIIYQECPQPGSGGDAMKATSFGYVNGVFMPSPGHVCVSVSDGSIKVDYIKVYLPGQEPAGHTNGEAAYSYTINPK